MTTSVFRFVERLTWELRRGARAFLRRFGWFGWVLPGCAAVGMAAWIFGQDQARALVVLQNQLVEKKSASIQPVTMRRDDARGRLNIFENYLPAYEDIPVVVQDLLTLAEKERLMIQRGEYRPQADVQGGFMRYRMALPVKGDAQAIYRFMQSALRAQKTLALESVQLKRERIESSELEARIQWVVLTRLPGDRATRVTLADAASGGGP